MVTVTVPTGQYLTDVLTLDQLPAKFLLDAPTGLGKSTLATQGERVVIATSSILAAMQIYKNVSGFGVWCGLRHDMGETLRGVAVTYDSLPNLLNSCPWIDSTWALIIDEQHNAALANYRKKALNGMLTIATARPWRQVGFMSGTPMDMPHGADYERVTVRPEGGLREQAAQFVRYAEGKKDATAAQIALQHVNMGERVVIYLDSKGTARDGLTAELVTRGIDAGAIHSLDSDNKNEGIGKHITDNQTLPEGCKVLITTAVLVESANINTPVGAAIILSAIHPNYAQQFVNRVRGTAVGMAYILNNYEGAGFGINTDNELGITWGNAKRQAELLNDVTAQNERLGLDDDRTRVLGGTIAKTVTLGLDGWEPCPLGVLQHVAELERQYCWGNPTAFSRVLASHNWHFAEPLDMTTNVTTATGAKELKAQLKEVSQAKWLETLTGLATMGEVRARGIDDATPQQRRAIELAFFIRDTAGVTWETAIALLATGKDSGWAFSRLKRLATLHRLAEAGDTAVLDLIQQLEAAMGETLTQEQRHELVLDVMRRDTIMTVFTLPQKRKSWEEPKAAITERDANELIKGLCNVRAEVFRDDEGNQYRAWRIGGLVTVAELAESGAKLLNELGGYQVCDTTFTKNKNKSGVTKDDTAVLANDPPLGVRFIYPTSPNANNEDKANAKSDNLDAALTAAFGRVGVTS